MEYLLTNTPDDELKTRIKKQLGRYNAAHMTADAQELIISVNDAQGELCAGLTGRSYWGCLHIEFLWVDESLRGQGTGAALMAMAEEEGRQRGCKRVFVDTFSFQAPEFYRKQGYEIYGVAPDYLAGHSRFYLGKALSHS
ncbi:GNAT family N-acetyltransferase [Cronobacter turicensis]|uniref:GNAT family N-acetyltransferase n=1 Tax=Cronobacter turicensis TaxID=413502 RepID=UPI001375692B|nr:GNAT family N-acetyltransferase [Cronobacter turicensis]MEB8537581.1 GNAT family N-acetyltransferase [Cronobacter sakazakii]EKM0527390.1 GNAT family N-acetyltransferase [Cronobacter turicensis]EKY3199813.1 GNAT family N-acetyltransferase [Cronobacter turicensis]EKY3210389.1 GNAT family N-acetyltransferase [Cronobacter turicensis]EKY3214071.1 GNAT family N-acetyltransferase [Cronobacter turicensis]